MAMPWEDGATRAGRLAKQGLLLALSGRVVRACRRGPPSSHRCAVGPSFPHRRGKVRVPYAITITTTRRFCARPSRVVLGATGSVAP